MAALSRFRALFLARWQRGRYATRVRSLATARPQADAWVGVLSRILALPLLVLLIAQWQRGRYATRVRALATARPQADAWVGVLSRILALPLLLLPFLSIGAVYAHDLRPGAVALREVSPQVFRLRLVAPLDGANARRLSPPTLPVGCAYTAPDTIRCADGLQGAITLPALAHRRVKVMVHVTWLDGRRAEVLLREGEATAMIAGPQRGLAVVGLGVEHVLTGVDHLAFVLALALIAGTGRRIAIAITGFTLAHSATLAATALGVIRPPSAATELVIAASILLVAAEAARGRQTITTRHPIVVATIFGLVHGFGFAGAFARLDVPADALVLTLFGFNAGVEIGQLAVVGVGVLAARTIGRRIPRRRLLAAYAIGIPAGIWTVERAWSWWAGA